MRHVFEITLLWLALGPNTLPAQIAPDGTPERAIQDMLLASKPEDVEKHLPIATLDAIKALEPDDRRECEATLLSNSASLERRPSSTFQKMDTHSR